MKKFYIVKDERDLLSGNIIPKKVLNYIPVGAFGSFGPVVQPVPIRKSSELVIPVGGPQLSVFSPVYSPLHNPVSITRSISPIAPLGSQGCGTPIMPSTGCSPVAPFSPFFSRAVSPINSGFMNIRTGPPIIKMSPMVNFGVNGIVKIISANTIYTINVPARYMRSVVNDIYLNSQIDLDPLQPKITFRIITPTIDSSLQTTPDRMIEIVKMINNKYTGLTYTGVDGRAQNLTILLNLLANYYNRRVVL
ncbi:MAG: hypothetical protein MUO21_01065 [Nitrososphaeraceae archaeon]|nr:hypothetical protein [Nitrososphaeraceae archaeon]